jgi:hypothetical protein
VIEADCVPCASLRRLRDRALTPNVYAACALRDPENTAGLSSPVRAIVSGAPRARDDGAGRVTLSEGLSVTVLLLPLALVAAVMMSVCVRKHQERRANAAIPEYGDANARAGAGADARGSVADSDYPGAIAAIAARAREDSFSVDDGVAGDASGSDDEAAADDDDFGATGARVPPVLPDDALPLAAPPSPSGAAPLSPREAREASQGA